MCLFRWLSFAYQWCSAPHSSPLGIHISHLYKFHALCSGDGRHVGHRLPPSSPLHSDMLRQCRHHGCHSLQSTLLEGEKRGIRLLPNIVMGTGSILDLGICTIIGKICRRGTPLELKWLLRPTQAFAILLRKPTRKTTSK